MSIMENELPASLPGQCTDIAVQSKQPDRVSVFVDGIFLGGFHKNAIEESGISKGDLITTEHYRCLVNAEQHYRLLNRAYRWLANRDHSSGEIRRKSLSAGFTAEEAESVLKTLKKKNLLDDVSFAGSFIEEKAGTKGWGPVKIRAALSQKGVKKQYIDAAMDAFYSEKDESRMLLSAAEDIRKRLMRTEAGIKRKKKLVNFLINRGFSPDLVFDQTDEVLRVLEHEEI